MKLSEARSNAGERVKHTPSGRYGLLTEFSGVVRVFVQYEDRHPDEWGTLPGELVFA